MKNQLKISFFGLLVLSSLGCSESDPLYSNCVTIGMKEQMVGWEESDRPSVKVGVENGCRMIVKECENNPESEMCKAVREKFNVDGK